MERCGKTPYQPSLSGEDIFSNKKEHLQGLIQQVEFQLKGIEKTLEGFSTKPIEENPMLIDTKSLGRVRVDVYNQRRRDKKVQYLQREKKLLGSWLERLRLDLGRGNFRTKTYRIPTLSECLSLAPEEWGTKYHNSRSQRLQVRRKGVTEGDRIGRLLSSPYGPYRGPEENSYSVGDKTLITANPQKYRVSVLKKWSWWDWKEPWPIYFWLLSDGRVATVDGYGWHDTAMDQMIRSGEVDRGEEYLAVAVRKEGPSDYQVLGPDLPTEKQKRLLKEWRASLPRKVRVEGHFSFGFDLD
jgi:hypothetical protein